MLFESRHDMLTRGALRSATGQDRISISTSHMHSRTISENLCELTAVLNAQIDPPRTYITPQTFDTEDGAAPVSLIPDSPMDWNTRTEAMNIGPDLQLRRHQGNAGQTAGTGGSQHRHHAVL